MYCASSQTLYASPTEWGAASTAYTVLMVGPAASACEPSQGVLLTYAEYTALQAAAPGSEPYDYANGAAFFAFAFCGVMVTYFFAHSIGLVLKAVRRM